MLAPGWTLSTTTTLQRKVKYIRLDKGGLYYTGNQDKRTDNEDDEGVYNELLRSATPGGGGGDDDRLFIQVKNIMTVLL